MPRAIPASGFFNPQRRLGVVGRSIVNRMERPNAAGTRTTGQRVVSAARNAMNYQGRGIARGRDLNGLTGRGVQSMRGVRGVNNRTRVDINSMNNAGARMRQLRATIYDPKNRLGRGAPGSSLNYEDSQYVMRNRNRRLFGYGAAGAGLGVGNAATSNNRGGSYRGPSSKIQTPKGLGRNA